MMENKSTETVNSKPIVSRERWHFTKLDPKKIKALAQKFDLDPILARILLVYKIGQGDDEYIKSFINPPEHLLTLTKGLSRKEDVRRAVDRISQAIKRKEKIMVNGDPDADGITATTILVASLRHLGATVEYDFPARSREGHGLQPRIIDYCSKHKFKLIITADCGSKDVEATDYARGLGVDVIVCDHHILGRTLPPAYALVNPHRVKHRTHFKALSGAGVAFKLMVAVFESRRVSMPKPLMSFLLAMVALGTTSDRMSLLEPMNRILIKRGVDAINTTKMEGIRALKEISSPPGFSYKPRDLARTIVPRLNAPGRIGDPEENIPDSNLVVDLLLLGIGKENANKATGMLEKFMSVLHLEQKMKYGGAGDTSSAMEEAAQVDDVNERRKLITSKIEDEIEKLIETQVQPETDRIIIVHGRNWNPGVIGIDTDRLKDRFLKPSMILTSFDGSDYVRGSVRSIPSIDMYSIIDTVAELFEQKNGRKLFQMEVVTNLGKRKVNAFGGHAQACGFTLHKDDVDELIHLVRQEVDKLPIKKFNYYYEIVDNLNFSQLSSQFINTLDRLIPYGQKFEFPIFYLKGCRITKARPFGNKYQEFRTPHVDFFVADGLTNPRKQPRRLSAVGFGLWEKYSAMRSLDPNGMYDIIFVLEEAHHRRDSKTKLRLNVLDIRKSRAEVNGNSTQIPPTHDQPRRAGRNNSRRRKPSPKGTPSL